MKKTFVATTTRLVAVFMACFVWSVCFVSIAPCAWSITPQELKEAMEAKEKIVVIDVRSNSAYVDSHIPGTINIPARLCENKKLPPLGQVVVYGNGLNPGPAEQAVPS